MKEIKWNDNWKFWLEKDAFALVWNVPECAEDVVLPHDAMILNPVNPQSQNGRNTGFRDGDNYIYVKNLYVEEDCSDKTMMLKFEGVYMNAFVYVNGQLASKNNFGYTTFYVPLNDYLKYGEQNEIRVLVKAGAMSNSRWYSGAGIYRDVYKLIGGLVYLVPEGVQIRTENIGENNAVIHIDTEIKSVSHKPCDLKMITTILDKKQAVVCKNVLPLHIDSNKEYKFAQQLTIENALLWSDTTPDLYECRTELVSVTGDELLDEGHECFGIRTISVDTKKGFQINHQTVKLRGACIHHDSGLLGAATYEQAQFRQIRKLKEAGFNAIRMAHHPMAPAMLRACDRIGMYVMDEAFDMWNRCKSDFDYGLFFEKCWEEDITAMVRHDYNHPSVVMYSLGNEISEIGLNQGLSMCYRLNQKVKSLDQTRYTLTAINGAFVAGDRLDEMVSDLVAELYPNGEITGNVNGFMTLLGEHMDDVVCHNVITEFLDRICALTDLAGYNYMHFRYTDDLERYPNRVIVGSETCPPHIVDIWPLVEKHPRIIGDFTWTGWDYMGEAGVGIISYDDAEESNHSSLPQTAFVGDIDLIGNRLPMSYLREIVYGRREDPYIAVQNPHFYGKSKNQSPWCLGDVSANWTWDCQKGNPIIVEVYAGGTEVELFQNGVSLGRKPSGSRGGYRALYETFYEKGVLEAVVYDDGKKIGDTRLCSVEGATDLKLNVEPTETYDNYIISDDNLVYADICICDEKGTVDEEHDQEIEISVEGNAVLLGFGSGSPCSEFNYIGSKTKTYHGRALAILKKNNPKENVQIVVTSKDKKKAITEI